jgi:predicted glycoside hydrolase/deacetylase ChbG (UPF0249 family)
VRVLIVRADDAGSASSANRAILAAVRARSVTAVGFMAPGPAFDDAVAVLGGALDGVDIGVHATLNSEWDGVRWGPLRGRQRAASLVRADGSFLPHPGATQERLVLDEAVAEIRAQIAAIRSAGLHPDYLDTHMGFDRLPRLGEALAEIAADEGLRFVARTPAALPVGCDFRGGSPESLWLDAARAAAPGVHQLIVHPGIDAVELQACWNAAVKPGEIARARAAETAVLCGTSFREGLRAAGIELGRFSDLPCA